MRMHRSVVVIEREPITALDLKNMLLGNGFDSVKIIRDFSEIFEILASEKPDLVIIDSVDSDLHEKVRVLTDMFNVPVLLLTDLPDSDLQFFIESGCTYIKKPEELITILSRTSEYII